MASYGAAFWGASLDLHLFEWPRVLLLLVIAQRVFEILLSRRNERWMKTQGAVEHGRLVTWALIISTALWLALMLRLVPKDASLNVFWLVVYVLMQGLRAWTLASLGRFWCVRVLTMPQVPLVTGGPYRYLRHPNYVVLMGEALSVPLMFDGWDRGPAVTAIYSVVLFLLLWWRIIVEERAIAPRRALK